MVHYIYLLQEREFVNAGENIYKVGKTKQENLHRFYQYPKGSELILQRQCNDCDMLEKLLIKYFISKYIHRTDIGFEYFEGNDLDMVKDINNMIENGLDDENDNNELDVNTDTNPDQNVGTNCLDITHDKSFSCKICGKGYNTKTHLIKHEETCIGLSILACPKCRKCFSNLKHKSRHIKNTKCKPYEDKIIESDKIVIYSDNNEYIITGNKFKDVFNKIMIFLLEE